jgi:preprotein translocase subunit YajC
MATTFQNASDFILTRASNEDLNEFISLIKMRRQQLVKSVIRSIVKGDKVTFTGVRGRVYNGTVVDVKIKNLIVETQYGRYRVPASMVNVVQEA